MRFMTAETASPAREAQGRDRAIAFGATNHHESRRSAPGPRAQRPVPSFRFEMLKPRRRCDTLRAETARAPPSNALEIEFLGDPGPSPVLGLHGGRNLRAPVSQGIFLTQGPAWLFSRP